MDNLPGVLAGSSVRAIIIFVAVALVLQGMRVKSPAILHRAWTGVLLVMLMLPVFSLWAPRIAIPLLLPAFAVWLPESDAAIVGGSTSVNEVISTEGVAKPDRTGSAQSLSSSAMAKEPRFPIRASEAVVTIYLMGSLVFIVRLLAGMMLSCRLARTAFRDGECSYSSRLTAPLTAGLFRARVFLPLESKNWDSDRVSAVLAHEMEHVRRHDPLVGWLGLLNRCVYWFHPLAWWLCGKLSALAEQSCDESVIARGHDPHDYAEYLLEFARTVKRRGALVAPWGSALHGSTLAQRIRRIMDAGRTPAMSRTRLALVTTLCVCATVIPAVSKLVRAQTATLDAPGVMRSAAVSEPQTSTIEQPRLVQLNLKLMKTQESGSKSSGVASFHQSQPSGDSDYSEYYRGWLMEDVVDILGEHYRKWLNEEVVYIIYDEEKIAFLNLKTDEERDSFIGQFWARRNPNPGSRDNQFKDEHYRRIAYVNERFALSVPGWQTSRGRIYIKYGPPAEIESNPSGGVADLNGRKRSVNHPFEVWRYHNIDNRWEHAMFLFVDPKGTGDYQLLSESRDDIVRDNR